MAMVDQPTSRRPMHGTQFQATTRWDIVCFLLLHLRMHSRGKVTPFPICASIWGEVVLMLRGNKCSLNPRDSLHHNKCNRVHKPNPRRHTHSHTRRRTMRGHRTIPRHNLNRQSLPCSRSRHRLQVSPRISSRHRSRYSPTHSYSTPSNNPWSSPSHNCKLPRLRLPFMRSPRRQSWRSNNPKFKLKLKRRRRTHLLLIRPPRPRPNLSLSPSPSQMRSSSSSSSR